MFCNPLRSRVFGLIQWQDDQAMTVWFDLRGSHRGHEGKELLRRAGEVLIESGIGARLDSPGTLVSSELSD
jgi:hypothetical protein